MADFRFRLASVLRYRERLRELRKWELHALEEERGRLALQMTKLEQMIASHGESMEKQIGDQISVSDLRLQWDFIQQVAEKITEQRQFMAAVKEKLAAKRDEVVRSDMGVKCLERLRSRLWEKYRRLETTEEQKLIDEVARQRHAQKE